jgi:hypothetical protein
MAAHLCWGRATPLALMVFRTAYVDGPLMIMSGRDARGPHEHENERH